VRGKRVLITGGAGFVGSHTAGALVEAGHEVCVFDSLTPQVHHGQDPYIPEGVEFIHGDVRDLAKLSFAVKDADVICHFAAAVGVGQSMYQISEYTATNNLGMANLFQAILNTHAAPEKIVVASSMSIYGEGRYVCPECGDMAPQPRPLDQLIAKNWETLCPTCGQSLMPVPTREEKPLQCTSVYALSKKDQEEMTLLFGRTYQIPAVALRYFNIYGTRQSLSNPYTGVCAIFASRLLNGKSPLIFEDGRQMRDFVSVHDVVQANLLALEKDEANYNAFNVGTGRPISIREIGRMLATSLGKDIEPEIVAKYREGDIRHCVADISKAKSLLDYEPRVSLEQGIPELLSWVRAQAAQDQVLSATAELESRQLVR